MQSIKLNSHVGEDGILHLDVPVGLIDAELEVTVIFKQVTSVRKTPEELGWSPDFFERTAGALKDDPLVRYPQGELQERNWNDLST